VCSSDLQERLATGNPNAMGIFPLISSAAEMLRDYGRRTVEDLNRIRKVC